jgi:hypothetical protein
LERWAGGTPSLAYLPCQSRFRFDLGLHRGQQLPQKTDPATSSGMCKLSTRRWQREHRPSTREWKQPPGIMACSRTAGNASIWLFSKAE